MDPQEIAEDDPRWVQHRRSFMTELRRRVNALVRAQERRAGRKLQFILEGQGGYDSGPRYLPPEPGWPRIPSWASTPPHVDIKTIARENLVDALCFWTFREIDSLDSEVRNNVSVGMRLRYMGQQVFTEQNYRIRLAEAGKRGVAFLSVNEPRWPLGNCAWMYPGRPGPFYDLVQRYSGEGAR